MGHWVNLDRRAKTPLPALVARKGCNWPRYREERRTGRGSGLRRNAGGDGADGTRKGGAPWR